MKYKVGDKVRVKENLVEYAHYGFDAVYSKHMDKYKGKVLTICKAEPRIPSETDIVPGMGYYYAKESVNWLWSDMMLEPVDEADIQAVESEDPEHISVTWKEVYNIVDNSTGEVVECLMGVRGWEVANLFMEYIKEHGHGYKVVWGRVCIEREDEA